jgi:hypothetical protein
LPELLIQLVVLLLSIFAGHVVAAILNLGGAALLIHRFYHQKHKLDSLELWKLLPQAKRHSYYKLAAFGIAFAFTMFRCLLAGSSCCEQYGSLHSVNNPLPVLHALLSPQPAHALFPENTRKKHAFDLFLTVDAVCAVVRQR